MKKVFDHNLSDIFPAFFSKHSEVEDSSSDDADDNDMASTPDPPSMHVCGVHEAWQSGDHSAASCGHSGHFVCDGKTHQQVQCPGTNGAGDQCTYTYWACLNDSTPSHNHVYPESTLVACGAHSWTGCTELNTSSQAHFVSSCSNCGKSYWSCNPRHGAVKHETTHVCTRPGCGQSYTECSRGNGTCSGGRYTWHMR